MRVRAPAATLAVLLAACSHTEPLTSSGTVIGPASPGPDILLTYNPEQDYWPAWTEDGSGILYAFIDASRNAIDASAHRCVGLMPAAGGTRFWQWCDSRATEVDSLTSIPAYALGADGRLLYLESTNLRTTPFAPPHTVLWLADSAEPQRRRALVTFPVTVGDSSVNWLSDLQWTGPNSFLGLAERIEFAGHCACTPVAPIDSIFIGEVMVRGAIGAGGATLEPVAGTVGATAWSLAEDGESIVFTQRDNVNLMKVPATGGVAVEIPATSRTGVQLFGVSCRSSTCIVGVDPVTLWRPLADAFASINGDASELRSVSLADGQATTILSRSGAGVLSSPLLAASGDVIVQTGRTFGHLQTFDSTLSDLHLYSGVTH